MGDDEIRLQLDLADSTQKAKELDQALEGVEDAAKKAAAAGDKLEQATGKAARSTANMGQAALQGGRALQDFAQGGIGGVLNNIEGLVSALGGSAGLSGILTAVGLAAYFALPKVKSFFSALIEGSNEVPKAKDRLKAWDDEIARANKELTELKGKQVLTNDELARFNELTERAAKLQEQLNQAKKREAEFEKLRQSKSDEEQQTASDVAAYVGPDIDALRGQARAGLTAQGEAGGTLGRLNARLRGRLREQARNQAEDPHNLSGVAGLIGRQIDEDRKAIEAERARLADEADKMVEGALSGKAGRLEALLGIMPEGQMRRHLSELTPDARRQQDREIADAEAFGQRAHDAGVKRRAGRAEGQAHAKAIDAMSEHDAKELERARREQAVADRQQAEIDRRVQARHGPEHRDWRNMPRPKMTLPQYLEQQRQLKEGQQAAREIEQATGVKVTPQQALQVMKQRQQQLQQQLQQAQAQGLQAILDAMGGQQAQLQQWRAATMQARRMGQQLRQPMANDGWN